MKAVYAGSFDPITKGHIHLVERLSGLCHDLTVLVADSPWKNYLFSAEQRVSLAKEALREYSFVKVESCQGLVADYAKKKNIKIFIRGGRTGLDFEYESERAYHNKRLFSGSETFIVPCDPQYAYCSSKMVKEIFYNKGDVSRLVPENVNKALLKGHKQSTEDK